MKKHCVVRNQDKNIFFCCLFEFFALIFSFRFYLLKIITYWKFIACFLYFLLSTPISSIVFFFFCKFDCIFYRFSLNTSNFIPLCLVNGYCSFYCLILFCSSKFALIDLYRSSLCHDSLVSRMWNRHFTRMFHSNVWEITRNIFLSKKINNIADRLWNDNCLFERLTQTVEETDYEIDRAGKWIYATSENNTINAQQYARVLFGD